jgi:adenylate cyclase
MFSLIRQIRQNPCTPSVITVGLFALVFCSPVSLHADPFPLSEKLTGIQAGKFLSYVEDPQGQLTIEQVERGIDAEGKALNWKQSEKDVPGFGFTNSTYWFRWDTTNTIGRVLKYYVELTYPVLDEATLFTRRPDGTLYSRTTGDLLPFHERDLDYRNPIFSVEQPPGQSTFYLRVRTSSSFIVPLLFWTPEEFIENAIREDILLGIFYGTMIVMLLYNLFIFASVRDISYLYYVGYILFWTLFLVTFNGLGFQYLWPDAVWWANNCLNLFAFTTLAFMQTFAISFLDSRKNAPVLHRVLMAMVGLSLIGVIASLLIPYRIGIRLVSLHAILTVIVILSTGIRTLLRGYKPARFFLLAWTLMLLGLLVLTLRNFAILPDNMFTRWSSQFGSALEVVFLALGLADRINVLKAERIRLEREAYDTKLRLLDAFARFVPKQFLDILGKASVDEIQRGDSIEKRLTVLFTDIRNFTAISEKMNARDNFHFLNSYLKRMGPVILNHGGFIDKFIGDAIMALFPEDPVNAIHCAVEMRAKLKEFNDKRSEKGFPPIEMGIGIHYGSVMLGTVGSEVRLETTVIGDTVNLASRLENLTKVYHSSILISGDLYHAVKDRVSYRIREIDRVMVRGRSDVSEIYEIYETDPPDLIQKKDANQELFRRGYELYRAGDFNAALEVFREYQNLCPDDYVASVYIQRCLKLADRNPRGWKGVLRLGD